MRLSNIIIISAFIFLVSALSVFPEYRSGIITIESFNMQTEVDFSGLEDTCSHVPGITCNLVQDRDIIFYPMGGVKADFGAVDMGIIDSASPVPEYPVHDQDSLIKYKAIWDSVLQDKIITAPASGYVDSATFRSFAFAGTHHQLIVVKTSENNHDLLVSLKFHVMAIDRATFYWGYQSDGTGRLYDPGATSIVKNENIFKQLIIFPNPFSNSVTINVKSPNSQVPNSPNLGIFIYDPAGRLVRSISSFVDLGITGFGHSYTWDGRDNNSTPVPAGNYLLKILTAKGHHINKIILVN